MRPPWERYAQDSGELQALETDVMRFIAILGLCLAAIFSLVNSAEVNQRQVPSTPHEPHSSEQAIETPDLTSSQALKAPVSEESQEHQEHAESMFNQQLSDSDLRAIGFTLEFESEDIMKELQAAGQIQIFVVSVGYFWVYLDAGTFTRVQAPPSYYRMHPETVPSQLRIKASGLEVGDTIEWGVTLPLATSLGIQRLMESRQGGNLVIGADAEVALEAVSP